jgi:hypothetical protein
MAFVDILMNKAIEQFKLFLQYPKEITVEQYNSMHTV